MPPNLTYEKEAAFAYANGKESAKMLQKHPGIVIRAWIAGIEEAAHAAEVNRG